MTKNEVFNKIKEEKEAELIRDEIMDRYFTRQLSNSDLKSIKSDIEMLLGKTQKQIKLNKLFLEFLEEVKDEYK